MAAVGHTALLQRLVVGVGGGGLLCLSARLIDRDRGELALVVGDGPRAPVDVQACVLFERGLRRWLAGAGRQLALCRVSAWGYGAAPLRGRIRVGRRDRLRGRR